MSRKGYEVGSRNVFEEIGVPHAEERLVKAQLVFTIDTFMKTPPHGTNRSRRAI